MAKQANSLSTFGMIPMAATLVGFILAIAASIFLVQSNVNSAHRQLLGQNLASEMAQQINIRERQIRDQLEKIAHGDQGDLRN